MFWLVCLVFAVPFTMIFGLVCYVGYHFDDPNLEVTT